MENIKTLLAAVAQTQGFEEDGPAAKTDAERGVDTPAVGAAIDAAVEKKKRGRPKGLLAAKPPVPKRSKPVDEEEDVCFICFDGGSLVLCDHKGCPKAYHPACIKRDESFFTPKAKWNCGWHICGVCRKASYYSCYTCTYSLCKGCTKGADYVCVRGNKGFCTICMKMIMLIENKDQANTESIQVDFDDKTSFEYLFKVYWVILKEKLSLRLEDLTRTKNPWKGVPTERPHSNGITTSEPKLLETIPPSAGLSVEKADNHTPKPIRDRAMVETSVEKASENTDWATKDMFEFISHMKNGDTSVLSPFDVQNLLLDYIKNNSLQDPRHKSQIICDRQLRNLFGKPRVGHIEMLKLLGSHFVVPKKDFIVVSPRVVPVEAPRVDPVVQVEAPRVDPVVQVEAPRVDPVVPVEANSRKPKMRKKSDSNEYAATNVHNMNLIYLKRNLIEKFAIDRERFGEKVIGSIVRIRVSGDDRKQVHRLVPVVGTTMVDETCKVGATKAGFMLEVLNLDKKEVVSIDATSDQEFTEDECKRLRQSIRRGLVKHFTIGDIQNKAAALRPERADDLLKESEEGSRRISEIPDVHVDRKMNPDYDTKIDDARKSVGVSEVAAEEHSRPICSSLPRNRRKPVKDKEERRKCKPTRGREKVNRRRPSSFDKHTSQLSMTNSVTGRKSDGAVEASCVEPSTMAAPFSIIETEKLWHYRDPKGKIQGPFSMLQLRQWSTTGLFPPDMRIWTNHEQYDSLMLTDALIGKFHLASDLSNCESRRTEVSNVESRDFIVKEPENKIEPVKEDGSGSWPQCWDLLKDDDYKSNSNIENDDCGDVSNNAGPNDGPTSSGLERTLAARQDLCREGDDREKSSTGPTKNPITTAGELQDRDPEFSKSRDIELGSKGVEGKLVDPDNTHDASMLVPNIHSPELLPRPPAEIEPYIPSHNFEILELLGPTPRPNIEDQEAAEPKFVIFPDLNPTQVWNNLSGLGLGEVQLPGVDSEWCGYSPTPPKPGVGPPAPTNWLTINETIEFDSLGEEYMSDLLAEVDAMESQHGRVHLPSPNAAIKFEIDLMEDCRDDCFSSIEEFSRRSDALSSTGGEGARPDFGPVPHLKPAVSTFDFLTSSNVHSCASSKGDTSNNVCSGDAGSELRMHETGPGDVADPCGWAVVQGNINMVTVQGNVNLVLGGPAGLGAWGVGPSMNLSPRGNSLREWGHQVGRQPPWGGRQQPPHGGGYGRAMHKGPRVCKFYESGHCKKGAFCDYLHHP